jgi:hypothetical protein
MVPAIFTAPMPQWIFRTDVFTCASANVFRKTTFFWDIRFNCTSRVGESSPRFAGVKDCDFDLLNRHVVLMWVSYTGVLQKFKLIRSILLRASSLAARDFGIELQQYCQFLVRDVRAQLDFSPSRCFEISINFPTKQRHKINEQ